MIHSIRSSALAVAVAAGWALPAQAQGTDAAAVQQELAAMRAQMAQMAQRIDTLENQLAAANAKADAATSAASAATAAVEKGAAPVAASPTATAKPATEITWDGAPKLATRDGWSFKPRGRVQLDAGSVSAPAGIVDRAGLTNKDLGFAAEARRAQLGFDGTVPGGFTYRIEAEFAGNSITLNDVYLSYKPSADLTLTLGHHKTAMGLEEMTSDLFSSFHERAAYTIAFGFERRLGLSATYVGKALLVQGGIFTDDISALNADTNNSFALDGRVAFMPRIGSGQLHIGGSIHYRQLNDLTAQLSYSVRPFLHTTDLKMVNTGTIPGATGERGIGAELAYVNGRFHASAESFWQKVLRTGLADPTFNGGYAELGYLLTDDATVYKAGAYDRIRPKHPLGKGGIGAIQVNARYDWLDLNDAGIIGGRQQIAGLSLIWIPSDYVRFIANYGHLWISDSPVLAGGKSSYGADAFGLRAQFDF